MSLLNAQVKTGKDDYENTFRIIHTKGAVHEPC